MGADRSLKVRLRNLRDSYPVIFNVIRALNLWRMTLRAAGGSFFAAPRMWRQYCAETDVRMLNIGCGEAALPGWFNTDLATIAPGVVHLNAVKRFPFNAASFDYIFTEHMIEHLPLGGAAHMLEECYRLLKPGGYIRVVTPDFVRLSELMVRPLTEVEKRYVAYQRGQVNHAHADLPGYALNLFVRAWGHTFIYDEATLRAALEQAGFQSIVKCRPYESDHSVFQGIECHQNAFPDPDFNLIESMAIEAMKPAEVYRVQSLKHA